MPINVITCEKLGHENLLLASELLKKYLDLIVLLKLKEQQQFKCSVAKHSFLLYNSETIFLPCMSMIYSLLEAFRQYINWQKSE